MNVKETLSEQAKRLAGVMKTGSTGPLLAAREVVAISKRWESLRAEAEDVECTTWCKATLGFPLSWFAVRFDAATAIGAGHAFRSWDHEAAVWAYRRFGEDRGQLQRLDIEVLKALRARDNIPPTKPIVVNLAKSIGLYKTRHRKACNCAEYLATIDELRKQLAGMQIGEAAEE